MWVKGRWMKANKGCWEDCECMGQAAMLEVYCTLLYRSDIFWHPWNCHGFWSWCWYPLNAAYVTQGINALPSFIQEFPRVAGWPANVWFSPSPNAFRHVFNHILLISHGFPSATSQTPQWHLRSVIGMFCVMLQTANTFTPGNLMVEYWTFLISLTYNFAQTT